MMTGTYPAGSVLAGASLAGSGCHIPPFTSQTGPFTDKLWSEQSRLHNFAFDL